MEATPLFVEGQKVSISSNERSGWEGTAVIKDGVIDKEGEIKVTFTNWQRVSGGALFEEGGGGEISCPSNGRLSLSFGFGTLQYTNLANEWYCVELLD